MDNNKKEVLSSLSELVQKIIDLDIDKNSIFVFRGESKDYGDSALTPGIYRDNYIKYEDVIYRDMQRFNDHEFASDKTTFDKLSRMQHHKAPTRLLDVSEDLLSAVYFAIYDKDISLDKEKENALIYVFEIKNENIKYYDSDAVSVVSNLTKIPLEYQENDKSKKAIIGDIKNDDSITNFNKNDSANFLRHEIREEKPQFEPIINPKHITSVLYVRPKLTSNRIRFQKGSFLLFGLNSENPEKTIKLIETKPSKNECIIANLNNTATHPIEKCYIFELKFDRIKDIKKELEKIGISTPFVYPEMDKVAEYLKTYYKNNKE